MATSEQRGTVKVLVRNFPVDALAAPGDIDARIGGVVADSFRLAPAEVREWRILSRSIDSRRGRPQLIYSLLFEADAAAAERAGLAVATADELAALAGPELELPADSTLRHPLVVGTGPAGIFAALALALAGTRPVILDRGSDVERRYADYMAFLRSRELDEESNLLIGEGGAGTFSDGKLYTGTRDPRAAFVLDAFIEAGAPEEIRYQKRPHIGSDYLRVVAGNLRRRIEALGGEFRFGSHVVAPLIRNGCCRGVVISGGERIEAPVTVIAPGLGGRSLTAALEKAGVGCVFKSFQIGCRIEHPQEFIDRKQYHLTGSRPAALGAAEYHMVSRRLAGVPQVSSFCMCPGGEILNATAWRGCSITNGMSCFARSGEFANGCLIVTVPPERFGSLQAAREAIGDLERRIFCAGGGDYTLPAQDAAAFLAGRAGLAQKRSSAAVGIVPGRLDRLVPEFLASGLRAALMQFDRNVPGFIRYGKLVGVETCVSSPIRFLRDPETLASTVPGLYLGGEGVGCAGGIMSAAVDGLKLARAILGRHSGV